MGIISTILNQAQTLFGRAFVIAAFLPSIVLLVAIEALLIGVQKVRSDFASLTGDDLKSISLYMALGLGLAYLVAYVVYGIRPELHAVFEGRRLFAFGLLRRLMLQGQVRAFRRRQTELDRLGYLSTVASWPLPDQQQLRPVFSRTEPPRFLSREQAVDALRAARASRANALSPLGRDCPLEKSEYRKCLELAHSLQGNSPRLDESTRDQVEQFIDQLRADFQGQGAAALVSLAHDWYDDCNREWNEAADRLYRDFPARARYLQPTRLGNVAMVHELYSLDRYEIPLEDLWPRLFPLLPAETRARLDDASTLLDFTLIMAFYSFLFSVIALSAMAAHRLPHHTWRFMLPIAAAGLGATYLFYFLAIKAMRGLGGEMRTAVDLHRRKLFNALGLERPAVISLKEEREIWRRLRSFFSQVDTSDETLDRLRFRDGDPPASAPLA